LKRVNTGLRRVHDFL